MAKHAIVKYNNGNGALLCNSGHVILRYGFDHVDAIHYCDKCKDVNNRHNEMLAKPI